MHKINIAGIMVDSVVDGPGVRVCIFAQGCPHGCPGCHNPESHSFEITNLLTVDKLYKIVKDNPLCRGVTFSGGEPFSQPSEFYRLAKMLREDSYEIACYTGFTFEELRGGSKEQVLLLRVVDVLIDGRYIESQYSPHLVFKGSENQRIIDVQASIASQRVVLLNDRRWTPDN